MRRVLMTALVGAAFAAIPATPAQAALNLIGVLDGNQCGGTGGFTACWATGTLFPSGDVNKEPPGSPSIARITPNGVESTSTGFPSITGLEFGITYVPPNLSFTYTPGTGDPAIHYVGLFQGGSWTGCTEVAQNCFQNTYLLFYDAANVTAGSFNLATYFSQPGWSHIDFFDTGTTVPPPPPPPGVPEPATWAMMLLGFTGVGMAMRRRKTGFIQQLA